MCSGHWLRDDGGKVESGNLNKRRFELRTGIVGCCLVESPRGKYEATIYSKSYTQVSGTF